MTKKCEHWQIESYMVQSTGDHAGLWGCMDCKRKFVPLDLEQEKDAARYRKLCNEQTWPDAVSDAIDFGAKFAIDEAIDAWGRI